jgi:hypothetical protein
LKKIKQQEFKMITMWDVCNQVSAMMDNPPVPLNRRNNRPVYLDLLGWDFEGSVLSTLDMRWQDWKEGTGMEE